MSSVMDYSCPGPGEAGLHGLLLLLLLGSFMLLQHFKTGDLLILLSYTHMKATSQLLGCYLSRYHRVEASELM